MEQIALFVVPLHRSSEVRGISRQPSRKSGKKCVSKKVSINNF